MRFAFDDDHLALRAAVRSMLAKECTPVDIRAAWDSETGRSPQRWTALAQMGVVGLMIPEQFGGMGLDEIATVGVLEETARAGLPEPLAAVAAVAAPLLADGGDMGAAGSVNKVFWSELDIALHETALDLLGPAAELESRWLDGYMFALSGPIYAGTNEVQRNIVAERVLGLPKAPRSASEASAGTRPSDKAPRSASAGTRPSEKAPR